MNPDIYEVTSNELLDELIKNIGGTIFIDFYQPSCGPCIMLEPVLEELLEKESITIIKVDISAYPEIGIKYSITATPTIIIVKNHEIKTSVQGYKPFEEWMKIIYSC